MVNSQQRLDRTFMALGDPTRRAILAQLERKEAASISELAKPFLIQLPAVMKHLDVLANAGLVTRSKSGRTVTVRLRAQPMREAMDWLLRYERFWSSTKLARSCTAHAQACMLVRAECAAIRGRIKTTNKRSTSRRGTIVKRVLSNVFLGALLTIGSAVTAAGIDADPVAGTWKLNLAKSTFGGGPALKSQIRTYSQSARGITLKIKTVSGDGKETTTQTTYRVDGKDYPSMGNPDFDSLSGMRIDTNTTEFALKRAGKPVGTIRRTVSKDGQTLTLNFVITNANGVQLSQLTVFDKQ
jgi:DNA-binding transcriptional ArsR family regulator